jgi:hypothetical protein
MNLLLVVKLKNSIQRFANSRPEGSDAPGHILFSRQYLQITPVSMTLAGLVL